MMMLNNDGTNNGQEPALMKPIDTFKQQLLSQSTTEETTTATTKELVVNIDLQRRTYFREISFLQTHRIKYEHLEQLKMEMGDDDIWSEMCANVTRIDLSGNLVHEFCPHALNFPNLNELNLSNNHIVEWHIELGNTLNQLNVSNNAIYVSAMNDLVFNSDNQLQYLNLSNNRLKYIPECIHKHLKHLKSLNVSNNNMSQTPNKKKMKVRELLPMTKPSTSQHPVLFPNSFVEMIQNCPNDDFVTNLQELIAHSCSLASFPNMLKAFFNLRLLDLSNNPMVGSDIPKDVSFPNLTILRMNNCNLDAIPFHLFQHSQQMQELSLDHNRIQSLDFPDEIMLDHMTVLSLGYNQLQYHSCLKFQEWFRIDCQIFPLKCLEVLNLSGNNGLGFLFSSPEYSLQHCTLLKQLHLKSMKLTQFPQGIEYLAQLEDLNLSSNFINRLPNYLFKNLPNLKILDLSGNSLADFTLVEEGDDETGDPYTGWSNLNQLNLSSNKLTQFPEHLIPHLPCINRIDIQYNLNNITLSDQVKQWQQNHSVNILKNFVEPSMIAPGLYLGSAISARSCHYLKSLGITHILTVAKGLPAIHPDRFQYMLVDVEDIEQERLLNHFDNCHKFMDEATKQGAVLVHCKAGISRSASVVISWLMARNQMSFNEAFEYAKEKRPVVCPNRSFINQLLEWEQKCTKVACTW